MGSDREKEEERTDLSYTMKVDLSGFSEFGFQHVASKRFGATQAEVCCWIKGGQLAGDSRLGNPHFWVEDKASERSDNDSYFEKLTNSTKLQNAENGTIFLIYCLENLYNTVSCWDHD